MSVTTDTAQIILEHLKTVVPDAECRRSYLPILEPEVLDEIGKPVVLLVPVTRKVERVTQGGSEMNKFEFDICVNAKLNCRNDEPEIFVTEIDSLIAVAETIHNAFMKKIVKNVGKSRVACVRSEHLILSDFEIMQFHNCFLSVVRINAEVLTNGS